MSELNGTIYPDSWKIRPIGELCDFIVDCLHETPDIIDFPTGYLMPRTSDIRDGKINLATARNVSKETYERRIQRGVPIAEDIIITREAPMGEIGLVPENVNLCLGQRLIHYRPNRDIVDPRFLVYSLLSTPVQHEFNANKGTGSVVDNLRMEKARNIPIPLPPLPIQREIAHILSSLDDKIDLNRRMNATLESMARAMFKSWFVDFDPVRAKSEDRQPEGMDAETAALFPDSFEDSELGEIPIGWTIATLGEISEKPQYGYTASASDDAIGPRFLRIMDINKSPWIEWDTVPYCEISRADQLKYSLRNGDIVIARMADPGHAALIEEDIDAIFASYLIRFRTKDVRHTRYLQYWLRSQQYWQIVDGLKTGTTRASLNAQTLSSFPLLLPSISILQKFSVIVDGFRAKIITNNSENRILQKMRELLLVKLLNEEIRL